MININLKNLAYDMLSPLFKLKSKHINNLYQWLISLIKPIETLQLSFKQYRVDSLYEINHTGQVLSLEHILNDRFSTPFPVITPGSIYITEGEWLNKIHLFNNRDDWNSALNDEPVYLFNNSRLPTLIDSVFLTGFNTTVNGEYQEDVIINGRISYIKISNPDIKIIYDTGAGVTKIYNASSSSLYFSSDEDLLNTKIEYISIWKDVLGQVVSGYVISNTYLYNSNEFGLDDIDFYVYVPSSIYTITENLNIINALIKKYKIAGYSYEIVSY